MKKALFALLCAGMLALGGCAANTVQEEKAPLPETSEAEVTESTESIESTESAESAEVSEKVEITLEEAVELAAEEAVTHYSDLQLTMVYSYDNDADRQMEAGADGARQWWYVNFGNEVNNFVSILIVDGVIDNVYLSDENGNNGLFEMEQVHLTAAEAVQKAEALGLRGGNPDEEETEWVSGFNFNLSWQSLAETPDEKHLFFEVIGISPDGNFAHVDFDAETGELLLAEEEICDEDGMTVEWRSFAE